MFLGIKRKISRTKLYCGFKRKQEIRRYKTQRMDLSKKMSLIKNNLDEMNVSLLMVSAPRCERIDSLSRAELERIYEWSFDFNKITNKDAELLRKVYPENTSVEYIKQLYDGINVYMDNGRRLLDFQSEYVNIVEGKRITLNQKTENKRKVYFLGSCTARGTGVEDGGTIPSFFQENLNINDIAYNAENRAIGCGFFLEDDFDKIKELDLVKGDIVVVIEPFNYWQEQAIDDSGLQYMDLSKAFCAYSHKRSWFSDATTHTNDIGNKIIADYIFEFIKKAKLFSMDADIEIVQTAKKNEVMHDNVELDAYIEGLKKYRNNTGVSGAIVMNCNPFTNGHYYLIEEASKQVDNLFIFVVEEDKSYFKFEDRLKLVKEGTKLLENVTVIPSGRFILSAETFPGYFIKDNNPNIKVDTSKDLLLFASRIAPALHITVRFAGEEPIDMVTAQYNKNMEKILPHYGIQFKEIKRKEIMGKPISASRVRKCLEEKDFMSIKDMVPKTTFEFLTEKYGE